MSTISPFVQGDGHDFLVFCLCSHIVTSIPTSTKATIIRSSWKMKERCTNITDNPLWNLHMCQKHKGKCKYLKTNLSFPKQFFYVCTDSVLIFLTYKIFTTILVSALHIFKSHLLIKNMLFLHSLDNIFFRDFWASCCRELSISESTVVTSRCLLAAFFQCDFAVVQYGFEIKTEFDLRESWNPNATLQKVLDIVQVCNVTKTASAMQHAL